jgi:protein Tex
LVQRILKTTGKDLGSVIGDARFLRALNAEDFTDERFGVPTIEDIIKELEKPGRDPRPEFKTATFQEGVEQLKDLQVGMILEGVATNITAFGAFVDIGVHQDGLVHISQLSTSFVKDPHSVVKAGDVVKVKVLEVDIPRKRIALTMRLTDAPPRPAPGERTSSGGPRPQGGDHARPQGTRPPDRDRRPAPAAAAPKTPAKPAKAPEPINSAFAEAFARAQTKKS